MKRAHMQSRSGRRGRKLFPYTDGRKFRLPFGAPDLGALLGMMIGMGRRR